MRPGASPERASEAEDVRVASPSQAVGSGSVSAIARDSRPDHDGTALEWFSLTVIVWTLPMRLRIDPDEGDPFERDLMDGTTVVGRSSSAGVVLTDLYASRHHARLTVR